MVKRLAFGCGCGWRLFEGDACYFCNVLLFYPMYVYSFKFGENTHDFRITRQSLYINPKYIWQVLTQNDLEDRSLMFWENAVKLPSPAKESTALVFPQFQDLSLPKRTLSTQTHFNLLGSISFTYRSSVAQQHGSAWVT